MAALSISRAWEETKGRIATDGRLMVIVAAALIALPMLIMGVLTPRTEGGETSLLSALILLCSSLLAIVGQLAIIRLAIGTNVSVGEAIGHGAKRMPIYFLAGILIVIALVIALIPLMVVLYASGVPLEERAIAESPLAMILLLLFVAFAFFLGVRMLMSSPVASEEALGPYSILRRSWTLTSGHFLRLFGFILLFVIGAGIALMAINWAITIVAVLLFGPVEPMSASALIVAVVDAIVNAAVSLLLAVMLARIYLQLAGREAIDVTVPKSGT